MEGTEARLALLEATCAELAAARRAASAREVRARRGAARLEETVLMLDGELQRVRAAAAEEVRVRSALEAEWNQPEGGWVANPGGGGRGRAQELRPGGGLLTYGRQANAALRVVPPLPRREPPVPRPEYIYDAQAGAAREKREWRQQHERRQKGRLAELAQANEQAAAEMRRAGLRRRREKREARARARKTAEAELGEVQALLEEVEVPGCRGCGIQRVHFTTGKEG